MDRITINLMNHVDGTISNNDGVKLFYALSSKLKQDIIIKLSLKDATPMTSSFLNSSFGELIDKFGLDSVKSRIKLINYNPLHAKLIQDYIEKVEKYAD